MNTYAVELSACEISLHGKQASEQESSHGLSQTQAGVYADLADNN